SVPHSFPTRRSSDLFPTIFALGIKNLGPFTKRGSSLLVMAILGAAVVPPIMGKISDLSNIQRAFLVPLLCYAYVWYFERSEILRSEEHTSELQSRFD